MKFRNSGLFAFCLLLTLSIHGNAQLIFDFGIGVHGGGIRLSDHIDNYSVNTSVRPNYNLDTADSFTVKAPDGTAFGFEIMSACTLTSPDKRIFYTATARPSFSLIRYQKYTPSFGQLGNTPPEPWIRDSLKPGRLPNLTLPVIVHFNYNVNASGDAVYLGLGASVNYIFAAIDRDFNHIEVGAVIRRTIFTPRQYEFIPCLYRFSPFLKAEFQAGYIWSGFANLQHEVFISASVGKGKQGAITAGYIFRFNFSGLN
jgi:hypothetical protein